MKEEIAELAEDAIIGFTKTPADSDFETAIVIGAKRNVTLDGLTRKIAMYLTTRGHFAEIIDRFSKDVDIDIKRLATSASLGAIGKNSLVITPEFGPRVRFAVVLTDALMESSEHRDFTFCDGCSACIEACPGGAITDSGYNRDLCEHSMGNVCVLCMEACPVGD
jgi:epoxyqueuosine reductase QueG